MKSNIQIFRNEMFGEIRTMTNEKGETFFVGKDVAKALGYKNTRKALQDHVDKEDKGVTKRDPLGGEQNLVVRLSECLHTSRIRTDQFLCERI